MASSTGTATNYLDLLNKLRDFLTTDAALVLAGEEWTQISGNVGTLTATDEIVLQGPGTSGTDEILVGIRSSVSVGSDYYNMRFSAFTIWNPAVAFASQVNSTHDYCINLWDDPMPYWFVANGRRFIVVVRAAGVYMSAYCGFILPYVLPSLWPYPMYVGASSRQITWRYSQVHPNMSAFFDPGETCSALLLPDVLWYGVVNRYDEGGGSEGQRNNMNTHPYRWDTTPIRDNVDGSYNLEQVSLLCSSPYLAQLGALQGVFRTSGFGNTAENIITQGGVDHVVVPNVYRTEWNDFAAIRLE